MVERSQQSRRGQMLATMAAMQEAHNLQVHPDWRNPGL